MVVGCGEALAAAPARFFSVRVRTLLRFCLAPACLALSCRSCSDRTYAVPPLSKTSQTRSTYSPGCCKSESNNSHAPESLPGPIHARSTSASPSSNKPTSA